MSSLFSGGNRASVVHIVHSEKGKVKLKMTISLHDPLCNELLDYTWISECCGIAKLLYITSRNLL
jgi:hypothetical protein